MVAPKSSLIPPREYLMTSMPLPRTASRSAGGRGSRSSGGEELQSRIKAPWYRVRAFAETDAAGGGVRAGGGSAPARELAAAATAAPARLWVNSRRFRGAGPSLRLPVARNAPRERACSRRGRRAPDDGHGSTRRKCR